jgi:hypothetical protein
VIDRFALEEESSLLVWYPRIEGKIPTPKTTVLKLTVDERRELYKIMDGNPVNPVLEGVIRNAADRMDVPFFFRSDQASGKHQWKDTCYVTDKSKIMNHLANLIEFHEMAGIIGIRFDALVFREYLPLQSKFTAFNGMPVAPEWRYFIRDGKPVCEHFYWAKDAIRNPSVKDWEKLHDGMQILSQEDENTLEKYATIFAENNPGYWSVDFALTRDKGWVLIDAARGEISWHPVECIYNPDRDELMEEQNRPKPNFEDMLVRIDGNGRDKE